jgi:hypothetical protein
MSLKNKLDRNIISKKNMRARIHRSGVVIVRDHHIGALRRQYFKLICLTLLYTAWGLHGLPSNKQNFVGTVAVLAKSACEKNKS